MGQVHRFVCDDGAQLVLVEEGEGTARQRDASTAGRQCEHERRRGFDDAHTDTCDRRRHARSCRGPRRAAGTGTPHQELPEDGDRDRGEDQCGGPQQDRTGHARVQRLRGEGVGGDEALLAHRTGSTRDENRTGHGPRDRRPHSRQSDDPGAPECTGHRDRRTRMPREVVSCRSEHDRTDDADHDEGDEQQDCQPQRTGHISDPALARASRVRASRVRATRVCARWAFRRRTPPGRVPARRPPAHRSRARRIPACGGSP